MAPLVCRLWMWHRWSAGSGCGTAGLQALDVALLYKDKKEEGSAGASPMAAPMPKSVPC